MHENDVQYKYKQPICRNRTQNLVLQIKDDSDRVYYCNSAFHWCNKYFPLEMFPVLINIIIKFLVSCSRSVILGMGDGSMTTLTIGLVVSCHDVKRCRVTPVILVHIPIKALVYMTLIIVLLQSHHRSSFHDVNYSLITVSP
jgi:hypothetical protein